MKYYKFFLLPILLFLISFNLSCESSAIYDRPIDTWVFRSVMDKQPRMLTVALNKDLYMCYNLQSGNLYKVWKGGVNYEGAVYTTAHGIQPTSFGFAYLQDESQETQWRLKTQEGIEIPKVNYLGYSMIKGQVGVDFELISKEGKTVKIREIPEYELEDTHSGLIRNFTLLEGSSNDLIPILNYRPDNTLIYKEVLSGGKREDQSDGLEIAKRTTVKTYFNPVPVNWKEPISDDTGMIADGRKMVGQSDCNACHLEHENLVGPAYDSIAKRYPFNWPTIGALADKIRLGGTGNWGATLMSAHPDLSRSEAQNMTYYILSLDGEPEPMEQGVDIALNTPDITFALDNIDKRGGDKKVKQAGAAANFYLVNDSGDLYEDLTKSTLPILNGIAPAIHLPTSGALGEINENFYVEFRGYIKSNFKADKTFRLISDDGSVLILNGSEIIDNRGDHGAEAVSSKAVLEKGWNEFLLQFQQGGGGYGLSLQWSDDGELFTVVPDSVFYHDASAFRKLTPYIPKRASTLPGDQMPLNAVHPSFDMFQAKPSEFHPRIGGIDFIDKDKMVICTWDETGSVYILKNYNTDDPESIEVTQIAKGLAEPLGIKMVDGELYVLQKQELTKLIDNDGDGIIDEYKKVCDAWNVTSHYHEFAFGLVYKEGSFYATLATDLGSEFKEVKDRGKVVRISKDGSEVEIIAEGFRTPNGIAEGPDGALYVADNQGNWIPTSKIVRVEKGKFYGFKHADWERVKDYKEDPPLVWLPHGEISNSPSQPAILNIGPYKDQMIHGDVTHGGIKRVFIDEVDGIKQGAAFRFIQGLDAGINRTVWGPDGDLYAGGVGSGGNWRHEGRLWYALHRFHYNEKSTFEMLAVRAKSNGMEIELTEPIDSKELLNKEDFTVEQYYYEATEDYGGPKLGEEELKIKSVNLSEDRKKVFLEIEGIQENKVVYIHIKKPFKSENDHSLWSTETWYTMTKKPKGNLGFRK
ncbi:glycosyl hydrolase [Arenibacter sp. TNZ]|jgi:cytochrome c|uniref:PA14 domain-containing protein n=1 Tax=Arenibacter TaxID=178469 RepID=UPI000CD436DD|nr:MULTISPECIES: PA14 domain-containing protein [Arenibacter]MCM4172175.1 glycosyl hydrolase [Arenibacter sp. TNZ]